jgi:hypothetical protein
MKGSAMAKRKYPVFPRIFNIGGMTPEGLEWDGHTDDFIPDTEQPDWTDPTPEEIEETVRETLEIKRQYEEAMRAKEAAQKDPGNPPQAPAEDSGEGESGEPGAGSGE